MAHEQPEEERVPQILRQQLALAVKSIQWSYAIFWSISSSQTGVLKWGDGYYNGDIKTRKTVQAVQLNADQLGIQRTEQLRDLYEFLSEAENNPQSTRPSAALSPEDLTDTEWYFLVCMSFVFNIGQGMPGRTLGNNKSIWLCNAHYTDSKIFCRTLLAKSASIQTVVCFPYSGGVIELGTTELVSEDPNIIQHIISFLGTPGTLVSKNSNYISETPTNGKDADCVQLDQDALDTSPNPEIEWEEVNTCSPDTSSEGVKRNHQAKESPVNEDIHGGVSEVQSWQFMEEEISNGVLNSIDSSDCISQTIASHKEPVPLPNEEMVNEDHQLDKEDCKDMEQTSVGLQNDDTHYQTIVSTLLKSSHHLIMGPCFRKSKNNSSFVRWKIERDLGSRKPGSSQGLLKKVLCEVAKMHSSCSLDTQDNGREEKLRISEATETDGDNVLAERRRREKMQEKLSILGSIVPSTGKVDQVSLLDDTIKYLRNLESKIEELESQKEVQEIEARRRRRPSDVAERTSDNYGDKRIHKKQRVMNNRKTSDVNEMKAVDLVKPEDNITADVTVLKKEKNVTIVIKCPWREGLLLEIMDTISNLHLDSDSVQSSNVDGNLSLTVKSKMQVKGSTMVSVKMIKEALQRVTRKS